MPDPISIIGDVYVNPGIVVNDSAVRVVTAALSGPQVTSDCGFGSAVVIPHPSAVRAARVTSRSPDH